MRYIDVIRTILRNASEKDLPALTWDEQRIHLNIMRERIDDIEIVVRCKDCEYCEVSENTGVSFCCKFEFMNELDDYCSYGEKAEKPQLSEETSTIFEKESVEDDLFNKSFWRLGLHDSNVRPRTMANTSTNEVDAESATTTDELVDFNNMISGGGKIRNLPPINQKQITDKLESAEIATSEGEESTISQPKSKLDCISREQAIEALDRIGSVDTEADREYARDIFDNLSPVTPTERTGEWKSEGDCGVTRCSQCGWSIEEYIEWNYCPNCGAKME